MPNTSFSDFAVKRSVNRVKRPAKFHWNSALPILISILGIGAWIAGEAFYAGYWNAVGIPPIASRTLQQTAFAGFAAAYYNWTWIPIALGLFAFYIAVLAIDFKNRDPLKVLWIIRSKKWWDENIEIDRTLGKLFSALLISAILFFILILAPLTLWIVNAMEEGKRVFHRQACEISAAKVLPSVIKLDDGTTVAGKILDRSENAIVFLVGRSIEVVAVEGAKSRLLDSTDIKGNTCSKAKE